MSPTPYIYSRVRITGFLMALGAALVGCDADPAPETPVDGPDLAVDAAADAAPAPDAAQDAAGPDAGPDPLPTDATHQVPMADGTRLYTRVWLPDGTADSAELTAILIRTPYRFPGFPQPFERDLVRTAELLVDRGYAVALQDVRGRFDSEGPFEPFIHEVNDGRDTTAWLAEQPWSDGRVVTLGSSYAGYAAIAAAVDNPRVVAVVADDPAKGMAFERAGGPVSTHLLNWLVLLSTGEGFDLEDQAGAGQLLDLNTADDWALGADDPIWQAWIDADVVGPYPADTSLDALYGGVCAPVFVVMGYSSWTDPVDIFAGVEREGCAEMQGQHRLVFTPEYHTYHLSALPRTLTTVNTMMLRHIDHHARGEGEPVAGPIRYSSVYDGVYHQADDLTFSPLSLALANATFDGAPLSGQLVERPGALGGTVRQLIDPSVVTPCDPRYPYATFTGPPLEEAMYIMGPPRAELYVRTDTVDADLFAVLYDINPAYPGGPRLVTYGGLRLKYRDGAPTPMVPGETVPVTVDLAPVAHRFQPGSRIQLIVSPGFCSFFQNPHTGEPIGQQSRWVPLELDVAHGGATPSTLVLPRVP